jgi:transcription antitermination factor NusG
MFGASLVDLADREKRWHVLHTKSRQEKALGLALQAMGIHHYLPLSRRVRFYGHRKAVVEEPVFPSYVFLWGTLDEAYSADRTRRVARLIPVVDQSQIEWELANIRLALARGAHLTPHPYLARGTRVEVRCGPLKGLQGYVTGSKNEDQLVLQVDAFGRGASLEIDRSLLEPIR